MVAVGAALAVVVAVGVWAYLSGRADACREWQTRYEAMRPPRDGVFGYVNIGPKAALEQQRPAGCPLPK